MMPLKHALQFSKPPHFFSIYWKQRRSESTSPSLLGRDFTNLKNFTCAELRKILWTALSLKCAKTDKHSKLSQQMNNCNVAVLMRKPNVYTQASICSALNTLGCCVNFIIDKNWEKDNCNVFDVGRSLSRVANIIVAVDTLHRSVEPLRDTATVPVINYSCSHFRMIECLANIMTAQEKFGFIKNLKMSWIGPADPALNTYILLCSKLKMPLQYIIMPPNEEDEEVVMHQKDLDSSIACVVSKGVEIKEVCDVTSAIYRAHIIVTMKHPCPEAEITSELMCSAALNWIILPRIPRSNIEVACDVFLSKNCLIWDAYENQKWILMALITELLTCYEPSIRLPDFEGDNVPDSVFYQS